jgi:hypothetical protein
VSIATPAQRQRLADGPVSKGLLNYLQSSAVHPTYFAYVCRIARLHDLVRDVGQVIFILLAGCELIGHQLFLLGRKAIDFLLTLVIFCVPGPF